MGSSCSRTPRKRAMNRPMSSICRLPAKDQSPVVCHRGCTPPAGRIGSRSGGTAGRCPHRRCRGRSTGSAHRPCCAAPACCPGSMVVAAGGAAAEAASAARPCPRRGQQAAQPVKAGGLGKVLLEEALADLKAAQPVYRAVPPRRGSKNNCTSSEVPGSSNRSVSV